MEPIKLNEKEFADGELQVEQFYYQFTEEEKERIFDELQRYREKDGAIEQFIKMTERDCNWAIWMREAQSRTDHRMILDDTIKNIKNSIYDLKRICRCDIYFPIQRDFEIGTEPCVNMETLISCIAQQGLVEESAYAVKHLNNVLKILESYKEAPGKRGAPEAFQTKLVRQMAFNFNMIFEKPTSYKGHPFFQVVCTIFEILDLPSEDPSRAVRKALASFQEDH
jgi:hypothetical protein